MCQRARGDLRGRILTRSQNYRIGGIAYVQSDDTEKTLHILPKYPAMPSDWDDLTADYDLPDDICETESIRMG